MLLVFRLLFNCGSKFESIIGWFSLLGHVLQHSFKYLLQIHLINLTINAVIYEIIAYIVTINIVNGKSVIVPNAKSAVITIKYIANNNIDTNTGEFINLSSTIDRSIVATNIAKNIRKFIITIIPFSRQKI